MIYKVIMHSIASLLFITIGTADLLSSCNFKDDFGSDFLSKMSNSDYVCRDCLLTNIWQIYEHFKDNQDPKNMVGMSSRYDYNELFESCDCYDYPCALNSLDIELHLVDIIKIYRQYGVIQLRYIQDNDKLLIGCGNNPITQFYKDRGHTHKGTTTINPELSMNPTIVGGFGVHDLTGILLKNHYVALIEESINPILDNKLLEALQFTLKDNCKFYTVKRDADMLPIKNHQGEDELEEISESPLSYLTDTSCWDTFNN